MSNENVEKDRLRELTIDELLDEVIKEECDKMLIREVFEEKIKKLNKK